MIVKAPGLRIGATGLLAVLTASTFLASSEIFNAQNGIYAMTHWASLHKIVIPTASKLGGGASRCRHAPLAPPCAADARYPMCRTRPPLRACFHCCRCDSTQVFRAATRTASSRARRR